MCKNLTAIMVDNEIENYKRVIKDKDEIIKKLSAELDIKNKQMEKALKLLNTTTEKNYVGYMTLD